MTIVQNQFPLFNNLINLIKILNVPQVGRIFVFGGSSSLGGGDFLIYGRLRNRP